MLQKPKSCIGNLKYGFQAKDKMMEVSYSSGKYPFIWKYLLLPYLYIGVMALSVSEVSGHVIVTWGPRSIQ